MKKDELKLCPFCGGKPMVWIGKKLAPDKSTDYYIQCSRCGNRTMTFNSKVWGYPKVEVVKRWNRRAGEDERWNRRAGEDEQTSGVGYCFL